MPVFDITSGIKADYRSGATPQAAYEIMKKIVVTFAKRGYAINWTEQRPPVRIVANLTDKEGTDLKAEVDVVDEGTTTRCDINIHGHVFLGGILGRLVSAGTIQSRARDKIREMLDENCAGQPSKRAATAGAPSPKPAAPSTLPPGYPAASPKPAAPPAPPPVHARAPASTAGASAPLSAPSETWASLSERVLSGGTAPSTATLIARASSAAGALGDATLIQFVQIALVQALAQARGNKLDRVGATQVLARIAAAPAQMELAKTANGDALKSIAAAYALTSAVGEAALRSFDGVDDDALQDVFGGAFERVLGEKSAALGTAVGDKLEQVKEAHDAELISETEMLVLRERVLAALS